MCNVGLQRREDVDVACGYDVWMWRVGMPCGCGVWICYVDVARRYGVWMWRVSMSCGCGVWM